jgi:hypothetical protein
MDALILAEMFDDDDDDDGENTVDANKCCVTTNDFSFSCPCLLLPPLCNLHLHTLPHKPGRANTRRDGLCSLVRRAGWKALCSTRFPVKDS